MCEPDDARDDALEDMEEENIDTDVFVFFDGDGIEEERSE